MIFKILIKCSITLKNDHYLFLLFSIFRVYINKKNILILKDYNISKKYNIFSNLKIKI